ncbi:MAG TPA: hypothetical protein VN758_11245 [Solirubrobacterales bacterium]|nr:hypothetical protein [Solirubrobacterales bacterium]
MAGFARALLKCCALFALACAWGAAGAVAQETQPAVHFDSDKPVRLAPGSVASVTVFNDRGVAFQIEASASLDPPGAGGGEAVGIPVAVEVGGEFEPLSEKTAILPAGRLRLRLRPPAKLAAGRSGWLTLVATAGSRTVVARRQLVVPVPTPEVDSWKITSVKGIPTFKGGGKLDPPIPLSSAGGCAALGNPSTVLVSGDETVSINSRCEGGSLLLEAGSFGPGTYKGKLEVGTASIELEIRRTVSIWWPVIFILLGILAAIATQGRIDQRWWWQQKRWLGKLAKQAAKADARYLATAIEMPWEAYELEPAVAVEAESLRRRLDEIATRRPRLLRKLPWPKDFMAAEREKIRVRIAELAELIEKWPAMPGAFAAAHARVQEQPYYVTRAPLLVERALLIVAADDLPVDAAELGRRCSEAVALLDALDVVDDLERLASHLTARGTGDGIEEPEDRALLVRARQYERQASATLAGLADSTKVPGAVGPVIERGAMLASRLPEPTGRVRREGMQPQAAAAAASDLVALPLALARRTTRLLSGATYPVGESAVILVTLAVGVLSGLAVLYTGKAWGGSWTDYAAAFVWGYAASTVVDPIVATVRQLGARPGDPPEQKAAT